jgi:hypothetical protein
MKKGILALVAAVGILPFLVWAVPVQREAQWKKVGDAMKKGLPKTAIAELEPIIASALKDKAYPEAIKAITRKIALEGNIQGNKPEEKIIRMKETLAKVPPEMVPVMESVLANWYWHFFQQNRWRFLQRTATAVSPGDDFTTWDLPRLFIEIDKQFTRALSADKMLKNIPIAQYDDLLEKGNVPDSYRPTLYDFLAHNALAFYSSAEQAAARAEDAFELPADNSAFAPVEEFLKWKIETTDPTSRTVKALRLYQELLSFHQADQDKTALLDADLLRLQFAYNKAFGEEKKARYKTALQRFVEKWGDHEAAAQALSQWATILHQEGDRIQALALAQQGARAFPNSIGGRLCHNLVQQIESKSFNVNTERVWNNPSPTLDVRYRNITKIHFRAVPYDFVARIPQKNYRPENLTDAERKALLALKPTKEWSAELPPTEDYHDRMQRLPAPKDLKPGFYFVIASHEPNFAGGDGVVTFTDIWVSSLALVVRNRQGDSVLEGFVLDALSGDPISGAEVKGWYRTQLNIRVAVGPVKTDDNGLFRISGVNNQNYLLLASHKDQELATAHDYYLSKFDYQPKPHTQTVFFTDRSLYRPGQTIQYQGICLEVNQQNDNYHVLTNKVLTVIFADRNGKEVARQKHRSSDYGSFSGSFTAPNDRVTGHMSIRVEGEPHGAASVQVEEYKRPKFQVTLDKPTTAAKLNGLVTLPGKAMAYTGAAVDGARVRYRVVRQVRYPHWWSWYYWWRTPQQVSQEIAHGLANTEIDGTFKITFLAKPDNAVLEKDEPTFHYVVYADVTDNSGETRSGQIGINVGYTALKADLTASAWQTSDKAVDITIRTATLDDEGQAAEGVLKIYRLKQPNKVHRPELQRNQHFVHRGKIKEPEPDLSNPNSWPLGEVVAERGLNTDKEGKATASFQLGVGAFRAIFETQDRFGKKVTAKLPLQVIDPKAKQLAIKVPNILTAPQWTLEPGKDFQALWGSGYDKARAFIEIEHRHKLVQSFWTQPDQTQVNIQQSVTEAMRGGFTVRVTMVRENRAYLETHRVEVPWTNKELKVRWDHFVSKLEPGQKTIWTATVSGPDAQRAVAEMVSTLYDASLDAFLPHQWMKAFNVFRQDHSNLYSQFENQLRSFHHLHGQWPSNYKDTKWAYRSFPDDIAGNFWGYEYLGRESLRQNRGLVEMDRDALPMAGIVSGLTPAGTLTPDGVNGDRAEKQFAKAENESAGQGHGPGQDPVPGPDLSKISARKNLNETAFFFPQLLSDKNGEVKLQFTMPEALTEWKFFGFAHDKDLRSGLLESTAVTARELMVQPHAPRFLREGDVLEFTVKVVNQSDKPQSGTVQLTLADARTGKSVDALLGNTSTDRTFQIPAKESRSFAWRLKVPNDLGFLTYKAVGSTGQISDGEEGYLPVLSRRVLVTESLPLPIRGPATKNFDFVRLQKSGSSDTLQNKNLSVQVVSQPTWYAVMALPYLMEFPYECTEQTFNRLYANSLARHIANSDPKIRRVFEQWRGTPALDSPLEKNQDLRSVLLEETPWVRQAQSESQARRNVGILFEDNRLNHETARLLRQLGELQLPDGAWPWFPGGPANDYITLYITTGFGRMRHLGVDLDLVPAIKSLTRLDGWIDQQYRHILRLGVKDRNNLNPTVALYLYGRSFFLKDRVIDPKHKEAVDYFLGQAKTHWLKLANRQSQAHLALALHRFGDQVAAQGIMNSIKEHSVTNEEMGMFWRDLEISWWWFRAPIETQAMMIEAFDEVMNDAKAVEECKVWLLKQKQTQDWKTTKATADAVYALLLRGTGALTSDALVEVSLGGHAIQPEKVEAGTGFYEKRFTNGDIKPEMGTITVKKVDEGVSWASVNWQYLEDIGKLTPYEGTPLKLKKVLYTRIYTKQGPVLQPVTGPLHVGDELVVRLELRVDRDMEYVHLKDQRGSGTEPVNVLSKYRYQDGLAYYESTRDTASHFFIDYLPKGTYVFEYATRVVHKGQYQTGMAQIQSMYAPEFNSHSESFMLLVQ